MLKAFDFESGNFFVAGSNPAVVDFSFINKISFHGSRRFTFKCNNSLFRIFSDREQIHLF